MLNKVANDVFLQIIMPNWKRSAFYGISPRPWLKTFTKVAKETNTLPVSLAASLAASPSFLRVLLNCFSKKKSFPTVKEITINIAFELSQPLFVTRLEELPELWRLKVFASALRKQWLEHIDQSFVLNSQFINVHKRSPKQLIDQGGDLSSLLDSTLCNSEKLATAYFQSYACDKVLAQVTVWLDSNNTSANASTLSQASLNVSINPDKGAELGFFRQGFDYSIGQSHQQQWLQKSSLDRSKALESAEFENLQLGHLTEHVFWERDKLNVA
jgi:hypothetical protein